MHIGLTCREAHRLASEGMDRELSLAERAQVRMHMLGCPACRNFDGQLRLMRDAMRKITAAGEREE